MTDLNNIEALNVELEKAILNQSALHDKIRVSHQYYHHSAFFERQAGQAANKNDFAENLLAVFADKNIEYTSGLPTVKVPTPGADPEVRDRASKREKLIYSVRRASGMAKLQKKWARDATLSGFAISETYPNLAKRCMEVKRYKPLQCYWQVANEGTDDQILVFWAVYAMTADQAEAEYGVRPTKDIISVAAKANFGKQFDGRDWYTFAIRWDATTRTKWVGNVFVEAPHLHAAGEMPIDICAPIEGHEAENDHPGFYLDPLVPLQAELNDTYYRRGRIVRRMSSPVVWVRGIPAGKRLDDVRDQMSKPGGGVIGLSQTGEAGLLQLGETRMLNDHEDRTILAMTRLAGYGNAAFGESVGANTSGDALGMYFNATQRKIEHQWISWIAFHESINAKILRGYYRMLKLGETIEVTGYSPQGTLTTVLNEDGTQSYSRSSGMFTDPITREVIENNFVSVCIPPTAAPRNAIEEKRIAIEAVREKIISRTTAYESFGILSPEDELKLVSTEQQDPSINPEGIQKLIQSYTSMQPPVPTSIPATAQTGSK